VKYRRTHALALVALCLTVSSGCASGASSPPPEQKAETELPYESVKMIELPYSSVDHVELVGDSLYLAIGKGDDGADLVKYALDEGPAETTASSDELYHWMTASDSWLVWQTGKSLYASTPDGSVVTTIATSLELVFYTADIENDTVVWADPTEDDDIGVFAMDLRSGVKTELASLTTPGFYNAFVHISDGQVLWTDIDGETGSYSLHDLETGTTRRFELSEERFRYPGYAKRWNDRLFSINFDRYGVWDWTIQEFGYLDTQTGRFVPVLTEGSINGYDLCGDSVAVLDSAQQLHIAPAARPAELVNVSATVGENFDQVRTAGAHTLAAWSTRAPEGTGSVLYLFTLP